MRHRWILVGALVAGALVGLCLLASCGGKSAKVVAKVGNVRITVEDYNRQYLIMSPPRRPRNMDTLEGKRRFLEDLINKEIMVSEATKRGFADDPELERAMKPLTEQKILEVLRTEAVDSQVRVEPAELREFYDRQGEEDHVQILIFQDRDQADGALAKVRAGTPFKDLAGESSLARAYPDADLGWRSWGSFDEPLNSAIFNLKAGGITDVIAMPGGDLVIARVVEIRPKEGLGTFEEEKASIMDNLTNNKRRKKFAEWTADSMKEYQVEVDPEVVERIHPRLAWDVDATGQERRPDLTAAEEALVIGTYRGGRMTVAEFIDDMMLIPRPSRPDQTVSPKEFERLIRILLVNKALVGKGYAEKIQDRPEVRQDLERAREERIVTKLYQDIIKDVTVTSQDVEKYYGDYKDSLREPERYGVSRIVTQTEADAQAALRAIRGGKSFESVAKERSTDRRSAEKGGKLSPATADVFPPSVREVVVSLKAGQVGGPVHTEDGWMVIRLDSHSAERQLSLDETRDTIRMQLLQARQGDAFEAWLAQKREEMGVKVFDDVLAEIELVPSRTEPEASGDEGSKS